MEERGVTPPNLEGNREEKLSQPSKPWHSYISEELPRSFKDSTDSAIRSARSLQHNSSTHLRTLQDLTPEMKSKFEVYEDAFFRKFKDGLTTARENPAMAMGVAASVAFLFIPGPRRFLFRHTLGQLQSEEARFVRAEKNVKMLNISVDVMKKESKKLLERASLAEREMKTGQAELVNTGKNIQRLARSVNHVETQAADLMDLMREIPGREALRLRAEVASVASLVRQQKNGLAKRMMKLSEMGVPV